MEVVVFTNGCFDILHPGHVDLLQKAKKLGTKLIVGINSDESVRSIKGNSRPLVNEKARAEVLLGLKSVDEVLIFNENTPQKIIEKIKPDILVKGGDWSEDQIIGADFVKKNGGRVFSIPIKEGYSSSLIIDKIRINREIDTPNSNFDESLIKLSLRQHLIVFEKLLENNLGAIEKCGNIIIEALKRGSKILLCGNGKSAEVAQYFTAELIVRLENKRKVFSVISLTLDTSIINAIGSNHDSDSIFSRQVESIAIKDDVLIGISTSGNSKNVISAVMEARKIGCQTIGLTGEKGKRLASLCDASVIVPSQITSRIQEAHITIGNLWCEMVDSIN